MKGPKETLLTQMYPLKRMIVSLILSVIAFFALPINNLSPLMMVMIIWIIFALSYTILSWIILLKRNIAQIKKTAMQNDGSDAFVFIMIIIASFGSMFTILLLMLTKDDSYSKALFLTTSITGMLVSWIMIHTLFTFHYAHMFYNENKKAALGLSFPGDDHPDYIDFAYFSFVIGCTFQVSDVEITSKHIRRAVLLHGLLSFALNTFVVALTINLIAGARHS